MTQAIFVYAGDPNNQAQHAPYTITRNVYKALLPLFERVHYYDWCHCGPFPEVTTDTIIIGHPNYPGNTATRYLFNQPAKAKLLIFPLHHGMPEINWPFDDLARQADAILSITGPYWYDTLEQTRFAHWKSKMVRLDMAIDQGQFPQVKTSFNPPGQRSFFYIGADRPEKGLSVLRDIFTGTSHILHLYGMIDGGNSIAQLPNVRVHGWAETVPQFARDLGTFADCYMHGGISDANPTTLLESACWGFAAACTPQSGYWPDKPFYGLDAGDLDGCRELLHYVQTTPSATLEARVQQTRQIIARDFTWDVFTRKIVDTVKRFL